MHPTADTTALIIYNGAARRVMPALCASNAQAVEVSVMEKCHAEGCEKDAALEVILYDFYPHGDVFFERDFTCPYICMGHAMENEAKAEGERKPRGTVIYPYTNLDEAQGFTIYRPLES